MTSPCETPEALADELARVLVSRAARDVLAAVRSVWREQLEQTMLHADALDIVEYLRGRSCRLGLLSNVWPPVLEGIRAGHPGFLSSFEHRVLSCRIGLKKPDPAMYREAVAVAAVPPHRAWMIGDSYELDMEPAMRVGMRTIWVLSRPEAERDLLARVLRGELPRPDSTVGDLAGVLGVLESLTRRKGSVS